MVLLMCGRGECSMGDSGGGGASASDAYESSSGSDFSRFSSRAAPSSMEDPQASCNSLPVLETEKWFAIGT